MTYVGKCQKTYSRHHTCYVVIFLTISCKLIFILIEWKIGDLAKTKILFSFKKIYTLTLRIYCKKYTLWRECKVLFFVTFDVIISSNLPNFVEIHQVSQKIGIFTSSFSTVFVNFMDFLTFTCTFMMPASMR